MKKSIIAIAFAFTFLFAGCAKETQLNETESPVKDEITAAQETEYGLDTVSEATLARYQINEIKDYQGMRLDPIIGPRDNSIKGVQQVDIAAYHLSITGLVDTPLLLTYDEVLEFDPFEKVITLYCVEGWEATVLWKGVRISDLLDEAGASAEAETIIFKAVDGYTTSLPLAIVLERDLILAYSANANTLPPEMGYPFIVVAEDKLGYKWARWVNEIEVSDNGKYKGFWEGNGFSNDAEVPDGRKEDN